MEKRGVLRGISPLQADKFLSAKFWTDPLVFGLARRYNASSQLLIRLIFESYSRPELKSVTHKLDI